MNRRHQLKLLKKLSAIAAGAYVPASECIGKEFPFDTYLYRVIKHHPRKATFTVELVNANNRRMDVSELFVRHHCTPPVPREIAPCRYERPVFPNRDNPLDLAENKAMSNGYTVPIGAVSQPSQKQESRSAEKTSVLSFADGESYHLYASAQRTVENNVFIWQLVIGVNGHYWTDDTRHARRSVQYGSIASEADALTYGLMLAEIYVQSRRQKRAAFDPEGAEQRLSAICYRLNRKPLRQFIHAIYPSQVHEYVKIVVVAAEHLPLIRSEICAVMRGYDDVTIKLEVLS